MCKENKEVIGREKGTKEEIKPHDGSDVEGKIVEMSGEGEVRKEKKSDMKCLQEYTWTFAS